MATNLGTFVAGAYTGTLNSVALGLLEEGYKLRWSFDKDLVDKTDGYGTTLIEAFIIGCNMWIGGLFKEYKAGIISSVSPYNSWAPSGAVNFDLGIIGRNDTSIATTLVLTSTTGTPAALTPATLTASTVIIDNGFNVEETYGPRHRTTPFMFRVYPYNPSGTIIRFFSCT